MRSTSSPRTGLRGRDGVVAALLIAACGHPAVDTDSDPPDTDVDTAAPGRWTGEARVRVVDPAGAPVAGASVMLGGALPDAWATTDSDGWATAVITDDGITDRWLLVGKEGWASGGEDLIEDRPPPDPLVIEIIPLAGVDNAAYRFQPGGDGDSMTTTECGHCHNTIADDFVASGHAASARDPIAWDLYTGAATSVAPADCATVGGWVDAGRLADGAAGPRCNVGEGVLPYLNPTCGVPGSTSCDVAGTAANFGDCGSCHAPAVDGDGPIDLARADGLARAEGVTCDLCHKVRSVVVGAGPGRAGSLVLERPSRETSFPGQAFEPLTFGPYADVIVGIMNGSYAPQMRASSWCAGCHEYARDALTGGPAPVGRLAVHETYTEWAASAWATAGTPCQTCHMAPLAEESSTYDISPTGLAPSPDQGWLRAPGEVRHHDFPGAAGSARPELDVRVDAAEGGYTVLARLYNDAAGHALPTGEPLRQVIITASATDAGGARVQPLDGPSVPDVGGYVARAVVGADLVVGAGSLRFVGQAPKGGARVRIVRPTGAVATDRGPGTPWSTAHPGAGLGIDSPVADLAVTEIVGDEVRLAGALPTLAEGDVAYLVADADLAGAPGWLFAKTLVDASGARGVAHYRAVDIASDNRIASGDLGIAAWTWPAEAKTVTVRVIYRGRAATVARTYGWDTADLVLAEQTVSAP